MPIEAWYRCLGGVTGCWEARGDGPFRYLSICRTATAARLIAI